MCPPEWLSDVCINASAAEIITISGDSGRPQWFWETYGFDPLPKTEDFDENGENDEFFSPNQDTIWQLSE